MTYWEKRAETAAGARQACWDEDWREWDEKAAACLQVIRPKLEAKPPATLLDLGCGVGRLAGPLVDAGYDVIGLDTSVNMLEHARKAVPRGRFYDLADLPDDPLEADAGFTMLVLQHMGDVPAQVLMAQAGQVIRSGGRFVAQFVEGTFNDGAHDHHHEVDEIVGWAEDAGFDPVDCERGLLHAQWTWCWFDRA